jgi:aryl-alcohol dehydrogenase-like predicted oxidoreductase
VNLRLGGFAAPEDEPFEEPLSALAELKQQGLVQHIGVSTVSPPQLAEAQAITEIVCIQNLYNVAQRGDDQFIDDLVTQGIAYVPYFPLGGFSPLRSAALDAATKVNRIGSSPSNSNSNRIVKWLPVKDQGSGTRLSMSSHGSAMTAQSTVPLG